MLDDLKFVSNKDPNDELGVVERTWRDKSDLLNKAAELWRADSLTKDNLAKQVAEHLTGKSVVIYGANEKLVNIWVENIALRAKTRVFGVTINKENPVELAAWRAQPVEKLFGVIVLKSSDDSKDAEQAMDLMFTKLSGLWPHPMTITADGKNKQDRNDWLSFLGELSSVYLAILHSQNPKKD